MPGNVCPGARDVSASPAHDDAGALLAPAACRTRQRHGQNGAGGSEAWQLSASAASSWSSKASNTSATKADACAKGRNGIRGSARESRSTNGINGGAGAQDAACSGGPHDGCQEVPVDPAAASAASEQGGPIGAVLGRQRKSSSMGA